MTFRLSTPNQEITQKEAQTHLNTYANKLGGTFTVPNDKLGEVDGKGREMVSECDVCLRICGLVDFGGIGRVVTSTVCQDDDGIIRGHVAVDRDRVEAPFYGIGECRLQTFGRDGCIGEDEAEEGGMQTRSGRRTGRGGGCDGRRVDKTS